MAITTNLGYPRIGAQRELKRALEGYWKGAKTEEELQEAGQRIRREHWQIQQQAGIEHIPSHDFSFYDHVLDTIAMVGAVPERYHWQGGPIDFSTYFAMARGLQTAEQDVPAMEMTKWFDTNYHYIVPEFSKDQQFTLASTRPVDEFLEAKTLGIQTRPVLLGPISFLRLGKSVGEQFNHLSLLERLLPIYTKVLHKLRAAGAEWVQIDEPVLALDLPAETQEAFTRAYQSLGADSAQLKICLATYFGNLQENLATALAVPVDALHLDLVRAPEQLSDALDRLPSSLTLSLGVVDGRNVWRTDFQQARDLIQRAVDALGSDRIMIGPSSSLMFSPVDLNAETELPADIRSWLAFARQKLDEIVLLTRSVNEGLDAIQDAYAANQAIMAQRKRSPKIHNPEVQTRLAGVTDQMLHRATPHAQRKQRQQDTLQLPPLPTTTIGSFPQTPELRKARSAWKKGHMRTGEYERFLKQEIEKTVRFQEEIGLDVLVHGEAERTDMVEYFGVQLEGFAFTQNGWVQSYGSRCVRPPIIFGDISRPAPMTVTWSTYAQSLTSKPMKGMLTGPVTILQWSFVRNDQPRATTCRQIALAIRDEVRDLEAAGIQVIQIDEPALREGLPLHRADWETYLTWAVESFRLASSGIRDDTQLHTHMCYSEFNDIIEAIADMDADVISIESTRSKMELLDAFTEHAYTNDIGPGIYDIHSPRIPTLREYLALLQKALHVLTPEQVWVNPDCGLKTRRWEEVRPALTQMVQAARELRTQIADKPS